MKQEEKLKEERLAELLKKADGHPMMKAILAEEAAAILTKREEAAGKIKGLRKEQSEAIPKLREAVKEKEDIYLKVKADLDAAQDEINSARRALSMESQSFDSEISRQEQLLIESADPALGAAITFFRDRLDYFLSPGRISFRGMKVEVNLFTDTKTLTTESNADAVHEAILYCQNSIKLLEAMKLWPEFHIEGIQELKDELPSIDVYQEIIGQKPAWPRINTDPRSLFKSDSQLAWEMDKLNAKFQKVMGRRI